MPRKPIDYSNIHMYKLCCKDPNIELIYVGSTTNWTKRKNNHKCSCNNPNNKYYNRRVYKTIRENGGWDNFEMIMLEKYPCKDKIEASARERYWFEKLSASLNIAVPGRKNKEYYEDNKDKILEQCKKYREEHKEYIKERSKKNYNREKSVLRQKLWRIKNSKKNKKQRADYYQRHKVEIEIKKKEKYTCGCGQTLTKSHKARHETSQKHQKWLESSSSEN